MKATELRIGNNVSVEKDSFVVTGINQMFNDEPYEIQLKGSDDLFQDVGIEDINPIPLTKEWITKLGGNLYPDGCYLSVTNLKAELHFDFYDRTDEIVTTLKSSFSDLILDRIYFVHQLQNLYFALTGEELHLESQSKQDKG